MADVHITRYIFRGLTYAFTSACAIFAGYLINIQYWSLKDVFLLLIPPIASAFFFICYANRFHPVESKLMPGDEVQTVLQREAIIITPVIVILVISLILITTRPPMQLVVSYFAYTVLLALYGIFLWQYKTDGSLPQVRHQLVWPVVLTIGMSLYYGLSFLEMGSSLLPLLPLGLVVLVYALSERLGWNRRAFVYGTLSIILLLTTVAILNNAQIRFLPSTLTDLILKLLFGVAASSYLAVFEAWRITAEIAQRELASQIESQEGPGYGTKASQYSKATLLALTVTIGVLPIYFVFSNYGTFFLMAFVVHAFAALTIWYHFGKGQPIAKFRRWPLVKAIVGFLFLAIWVAASRFKDLPTKHYLPRFVGWSGFTVLMVLSGLPTSQLFFALRRIAKKGVGSVFLRLFERRINFVRLLSLFSVVASFLMAILLDSFSDSSDKYRRAELAFFAYSLCIIVCLIVELIDRTHIMPLIKSLFSSIIGVLLAIRTFTSVLIGLIVFLPSAHEGIGGVNSLLLALPFFLAAAGGFALNDYYDVPKDCINKPYRAIPSGRLSSRTVLVLGYMLIIGAVLTAIIRSEDSLELVLYLLSVLGVVFYNVLVKRLTLSKTFVTAAVSTLPVIFVVVVFKYSTSFFAIPVGTSIFVLGREWLMDTRDMRGDAAAGVTTLPMIIGSRTTALLGLGMLIAGVICLLPVVIANSSSRNVVLFISALFSIAIASVLWGLRNGDYQRAVIVSLYFPIVCGIVLLLR
ncbi:MAG TPA: UbiA family prenyltransferase [Pyrinomonadaceae bacterium]|nr:UbiA family prenyltransferase [Pyrinomonadaceae bacterium]